MRLEGEQDPLVEWVPDMSRCIETRHHPVVEWVGAVAPEPVSRPRQMNSSRHHPAP